MADLDVKPTSKYGAEEIELMLATLANNSGKALQTERDLQALGWKISRKTIDEYRKRNHKRYLELQQEIVPQIRARAAERAAQLAELQADVEEKATRRLEASLDELEPRDLSNALRNISTARGIGLTHMDRLQAPAGQPQQVRDMQEILSQLARLGVAKIVEAEAEEIPEAEVVSG